MDGKRAAEIMESHGVIEVLYNGSPVWLVSIKDDIAEVSYIKTGKRIEVPLDALTENSRASNQGSIS